MKISFIKKCAGIVLAGVLLLAGCSTVLENKESDAAEYGSLVVGADSRALDVSAIKSAVVTVTGNGIDSPISKTCSDITDGKGSVRIERIPVGRNRIVSVQARSAAAEDIEGAVIRAVVNIDAGENTLPVISWETSRKGYVYNALLEGGVNISSLDAVQIGAIDNATPTCDATNINLPLFVSDFKKGYDCLQDREVYVLSTERTLKRLVVSKADVSTADAPSFTATAYWSDGTEKDVTDSAQWTSSAPAVATVNKGAVALVSAGKAEISGTYTDGGVTKKGAVQTLTVTEATASLVVYMDAGYGEVTGGGYLYGWKGEIKPFGTWPGTKMTLTDDGKAYYFIIEDAAAVELIIINNNGTKQTDNLTLPGTDGHYLCYHTGSKWDWKEYTGTKVPVPGGGALTATITAGEVTEPMEPEVTISPASGKVGTGGTITVTYKENNASVTAATVIFGGSASKTCSLTDFTNKTLSVRVADLGITEEGKTITVSASVTNSEGTARASCSLTTTSAPAVPDTFTWDNVNAYFVLTDRFYNGDKSNDHSYGRNHGNAPDVAAFHGGDIVGLTQKLDYLEKLGVNAIWITAPYEQAHGWTDGKNGAFPHYAFHGYYTLDWTFLDQNMGTIEEFRTFVDEAHKRGIRIVMDVVMNHTGYFTMQDVKTYDCGVFKNNKTPPDGWCPTSNWKQWNDNHEYSLADGEKWGNFWGKWVRAFKGNYGFSPEGSDDITGPLSGLPDVVTEMTEKVAIPSHLKAKWGKELSGNKNWVNPSVANVDWGGMSGDWRQDNKGAPADYIVAWLSAWVREFGIDGFRCDTAKHVHMYRWGQLKTACEDALKKWRADPSKADSAGAKNWDENFWMTGECFGWSATNGQGDYYTTGKFDSMINFSFNASSGNTGRSPTTGDWDSYININKNDDSDKNGNRNSVLSYVSSHDTGLHRSTPTDELGTMLVLLPGGVQIYYGDESGRPEIDGYGDADMKTRGDMNWTTPTHWGKVGTFRKYNPAVGAGTGSATKRSYTGPAGESKVAIGISGTSVDVNGLFGDGTTVYNWYDGKSAQVSGGTVTFAGGTKTQPILVSDKNPADYGVTF